MLFIKDYDFTHTINLWFLFYKETLSATQYEDNISKTVNLEKSMKIYHIYLHSYSQVKILDNQHKRLFDLLRLIYNWLYEGET